MAPRGAASWRRPHTSIYNDNYKYGTNLYSGTLNDIHKKYTDSISRTQLRSDRPDLGFSSFAGSNLGSSPTPAGDPNPGNLSSTPVSPIREAPLSSYRGSVFESMLNSALHSSYATGGEEIEERKTEPTVTLNLPAEHTESPMPFSRTTPEVPSVVRMATSDGLPRPLSLYDDAGFFTPMRKAVDTSDLENRSSSRRKKYVREISASATAAAPQNGPSGNPNYWKDQCRDLQSQVDMLTQAMADMSNKLKGELSTMKSKLHNDVGDLHASLEHSTQQSNELHKTVRQQANQLLELQSAYEDLQRNMQDSLDEVSGFQKRNQTLRKEMDRLRAEVEDSLQRSATSRA